MRIISGNLKGKKIELPSDKSTRPLKDLTKESIFNIIQHSNLCKLELKKSNILDCFSGTGSFGLECISRGAKKVIFIENYEPAIQVLEKNITNLKVQNLCEIYRSNISNFFKNHNGSKFDLIFFDPPYKFKEINNIFKIIYENNLLDKNGIIILHRHKKSIEKLPVNFNQIESKIYGISKIIFYKSTY